MVLRGLTQRSADMVQSANSGHPGAPMGMAPMAHVLWSKVMTFAPSQPNWVSAPTRPPPCQSRY